MSRKGKIVQANGNRKVRSKGTDQKLEHPEGRAKREKERTLRQGKKDGQPDLSAADYGVFKVSGKKAAPGNGRKKDSFPVIGIGASAGGLQALEIFFSSLPEESGMAYVVISHTNPGRTSMLPDILKRKTKIPVISIGTGMPVEPDTLYLPPSDRDLIIKDRVFHLIDMQRKDGLHMPINTFLRSIADDCRVQAGCIILSGTGSDGTQGLRAINGNSGITVAQIPESAQYSGMPRSAIETGLVDLIMTPEEMSAELIRYFKNPAAISTKKEKASDETLPKILTFLARRAGHDYSLFQNKKRTLIRRIEWRMNTTRSRNGSEYFNYLYRNPKEVEALFSGPADRGDQLFP